ncbi:Lactate utilization protein A [Planctomycetes bacterium Poly30]|uniref:Glycolate oxidase iron-sulfur subunit n=1 Tax=Saltatorellus ferox TaxID=2528018 RepID=A0A518EXM6_9BACT|nr:Lactate utilization protein A [Planctomycetes bacterium Poly30]
MSTEGHRPHPSTKTSLIDHARSLDCIHCGLCLTTCPTYQLTGSETSSPRGRIHLMRAVAEDRLEPDAGFAEEMDFCLVCRHCESVCPAGVEFGAMMEFTRSSLREQQPPGPLARFARWVGFRRILPSRFGLKAAVLGLQLGQTLGLIRLAAPLLGLRGSVMRHLPKVPPRSERRPLPAVTPAQGEKRDRVLVLEGCVMPELFGRVNHAVARTLSATGLDVLSVPKHVCCGALHAHNGEMKDAEELARETIRRFDAVDPSARIVVDSAGCGAHMREYGRLLANDPEYAARAAAFGARVVDYSEELSLPAARARLRPLLRAGHGIEGPITWDDPCHLCHGQGVVDQPRQLLDLVPGLERREMTAANSCCGSAGIYSVLRPKDSLDVLAPKLEHLAKSGAKTLVTANPGCHQQWLVGIGREGMDVPVLHLAEVLDRAISAGE